MGYPPPTRRLSDKKRYHYSNNPNRRHLSGVYPKNGFSKPIINGFTSSPTLETTANASVSPASVPPPPPPSVPGTFGIEAPRPSRYDPGSVNRPSSSSYLSTRKIGSRYNPEAERLSSAGISTPENTNANTTPNANIDTGKSRYSRQTMSRYNPQSNSSSNIMHFSPPTSNTSPFYVPNGNSRGRPRSMDDHSPDTATNPEPSSVSLASSNSAHSYYSRSNKWRSIGTPSRSPFENHVSNTATTNITNGTHQREPFWKANNTSLSKSNHSQSSPSLHDIKFHEINKMVKPESPVKIGGSDKDETKDLPYDDDKFQSEKLDIMHHVSTGFDSFKPHENESSEEDSSRKRELEIMKIRHEPEKRKEHSRFEDDFRKLKTTSVDVKQDGLWTTTTKVINKIEKVKEQKKEQIIVIKRKESPEIRNYEMIHDPEALKTDLTKLTLENENKCYGEPLHKVEACIFPLPKAETRLWELKNQRRDKIISKQKYLLKKTVKSFTEYPFYAQNKLIHQQATGLILTNIISKIKKQEYLKKINLKHNYFGLQKKYEKECETLAKLSENLRKEEIENKRKEHELMEQRRREGGVEIEKEKDLRNPSSSSSSRRRNRADFVDDAEMENVLLQIDPNYKHYQAAATIPPLILNPVEKYSYKFCDVNNLVTDKNHWASRILKDGIDTFSDHEHSLFLEGYLIHPKKFGKISHYMGGLRTPEECVLHYYRTKKTINYKQLLIDKNKKRKMSAAAKRRKRKERSNDEELENDEGKEESVTTADKEEKSENLVEEIVYPILVQVPEADGNSQDNPEKLVENTAEKESEDVTCKPEETVQANELKRVHDVIGDKDSNSNVNKVNSDFSFMAHREGVQNDYYAEEPRELDFSLENALQRKKHRSAPEHKTSYWSVRESQLFPELLNEFGSQWSLISEKLGTKSTTMVRNYYQRNAARNGWKLIVDETDLKRDGTSSESVQQSQIMIQPERPNINAYNNIPPQQGPALGYFVGQPTHGPNTSISSVDGSMRPFGPDFHRDSFSKVSTPLTTLPPPRLPSIQFPHSEMAEPTVTDLRNRTLDHIDTLAEAASTVTNNQNFSDERHALDTNHKSTTISSLLNNTDRDVKASFQSSSKHQAHVEDTPNLNNIVVQEIKPNITTPRSSSISALLNPVHGNGQLNPDGRPLLPFNNITSRGPPSFPLPPPRTSTAIHAAPKFNFSNDPLAALAAVASAPDAINGFLSKKDNDN